MKIKSIALILLCAVLVLSMAACGKADTTVIINNDGEGTSDTALDATDSLTQNPTGNSVTEAVDSAPVDASYFDDAAFVGDSVSLKLSYYAMSNGKLGQAQFFTSGSLGSNNALWEISDESVHPSYRGEKMLIEDCIANSGAKKVYIMLGMNDLGLYGIDATLESYKTLVGRILEKSPEASIIVQSMTPMTDTSYIWGEGLNNTVIGEYNSCLETLCEEEGWKFIDVASVMYDANGNLERAYCSDPDDMGVHFTEEGCDVWIEYLYTHY